MIAGKRYVVTDGGHTTEVIDEEDSEYGEQSENGGG